jgi:hypothetical protein
MDRTDEIFEGGGVSRAKRHPPIGEGFERLDGQSYGQSVALEGVDHCRAGGTESLVLDG